MLIKKDLRYFAFHWFMHLFIVHLIAFSFNFSLIGYRVKILFFDFPIFDYIIMYIACMLVDLDHLIVFRKYGIEGIKVFSKVRIPYPFHNLFFISILLSVSLIFSHLEFKQISILLLSPLSNLIYDMLEDLILFKVSWKKWKRIWGIDSRSLEILFKEIKQK